MKCSNTRILLVDDELEFAETLSERLALRGIPSMIAGGGEEALGIVRSSSPPLVVLDVSMPSIGGLEVLKRIKELSPTTQVILLSGQGSVRDAIEGMQLGAFDYLMKPLVIEQLIDRMREAVWVGVCH